MAVQLLQIVKHHLHPILRNKSVHIVVISMFVFIFLNFAENLIHYNLGKNTSSIYQLPEYKEILKIIGIMLIFAVLQGLITELLL